MPPDGRELTGRRPRPLGRDHAQPHRQARRLRARDPQAGRRPDRDPAARRPRPGARRRDHRQDRAARALRPRGRPHRRRRATSQGDPGREPTLYNLLARASSRRRGGTSRRSTTSSTHKKKLVAGPARRHARRSLDDAARRGAAGRRRSCPRAGKLLGVPEGHDRHHLRHRRALCPGVQDDPPTRTYFYLFKYEPNDAENPVPEMTGKDLKLSGTRQDFDPQTASRSCSMQFTDAGGDKFHDVTREIASAAGSISRSAGAAATVLAALRDRARRRDQVGPDDRLQREPGRDPRRQRRADHRHRLDVGEAKDLALVLQTGALPVKFVTVERTRRLGDARQGLAAARRKSAAIAGLLVVALFLLSSTASSASSRCSASASTPPSSTRRSCSSTSR